MNIHHDPPEVIRLGFTMLDRQIIAADGTPVGKVDDVELELPEDDGARPRITALLTDSAALGPRLAGRLGWTWQRTLSRLRPKGREPGRVPLEEVDALVPTTRLNTSGPEGALASEHWLRDHVITRIPGAGHADDAGQ